jgi:polyhydroxyalkanoate depolymerase
LVEVLYQAYQAHVDLMAPLRSFAKVSQDILNQGRLFGDNIVLRSAAAGWEMLARAGISHDRPPFGLNETIVDGRTVPVTEEVSDHTPFCGLLHFKKPGSEAQPRLLVVAPMSGHFATLLRGTVETLLPDHDVYITDWYNARAVSLLHGTFAFDDFVNHVIRFLHVLGKGAHIVAVCQPAVPVLAAVALMAASGDPEQPATMTLMGGPIDTRRNPTQVNEFATSHSLDWFERNVIGTVPLRYPGAFRRVYPGFLQLAGFMSMHLDRHVGAHVDMFENLVKGDGASVEATRAFYDEYLSVMDMPADFFLQTIEGVFQEFLLPRGLMVCNGEKVEPAAIERTALLTIEGERDDICAVGQTSAAHDLVTRLQATKRHQHLQPAVGHYGVFNGRRWSTEIYPVLRDFIRRQGLRAAA